MGARENLFIFLLILSSPTQDAICQQTMMWLRCYESISHCNSNERVMELEADMRQLEIMFACVE